LDVLNIFRRSLKTGLVTTSYPETPEPAPPAYRGQVQLYANRCTGEGACAKVCPSAAITFEHAAGGWSWELNDARCVFCGLCAGVCQSAAIELSNEFELAVCEPTDLVTRLSFTTKKEKAL
jgi:formate hydrogenlyase subunit 6/NADH:ubiquinone oxidoreductase subunit I